MAAYALTIFIGAFLLFEVQPLIGKYILPWFGGGPGVWTTCLLFFQIVLLAGYTYSHLSTRWLRPRSQVITHLVLLAAALALLPIIPKELWKPQGGGNPTVQILGLLTVTLGLPYFVLSTTGPLIQQWFSRTNPGVSPYRLYALSNAGSLLALLSYPFYFESHFARKTLAQGWGWGLALYVVCCGVCGIKLWRSGGEESRKQKAESGNGGTLDRPASDLRSSTLDPRLSTLLLWLMLPACASALLLATTNKMCQDVAVVPFLWVLPLALYLLSFIICFDSPRWYVRFPYALAFIWALGAITWVLFKGIDASVREQVIYYCAGLFVCCLVCHGELYRLRPDPRHLTTFYLMIAAGGAVGGLFVAVVAPMVFKDYYELHWSLFGCGLLFLIVCLRDPAGARQEDLLSPAVSSNPDGIGTGIGEGEAEAAFTDAGAPVSVAQPGGLQEMAPASGSGLWRWSQWQLLACALPIVALWGLDHFYGDRLPDYVASAGKFWARVPKGCLTGARIGLWVVLVLFVASWLVRKKFQEFRFWKLITCLWLGAGLVALGVALVNQPRKAANSRVYTSRNFYGVLNIYEESKEDPQEHNYRLQHGRITHGLQYVDPDEAIWPTTYYGRTSGVGMAMRALTMTNRHIGLVGLGTGTLAVYGQKGDYLRIYEINPEVKRLATSWFTYITNSAAKVEVALGDARLSMEREPPQQFDLLALDAFSGDAIPMHLLTKEAFDIYQKHVKTNGVIAVHISNHYLDLEPVVVNLAKKFNYQFAEIDHEEGEEDVWDYSSTWILLSRNPAVMNFSAIVSATTAVKTNFANVPLWTDDFCSVLPILK